MKPLPTMIVHGRKGHWYADVDDFGVNIPVCHDQYLTGNSYRQSQNLAPYMTLIKKAEQAEALRRGFVVISTDQRPPDAAWHRTGYTGLFRCSNTLWKDRILTFDLGNQIAYLMRPSDYRRFD